MLEYKTVNSLNYRFSTQSELGYLYLNFEDEFIFIGRNNKIIGSLSYLASVLQIDMMIKQTMASFHGLQLREHKPYHFLKELPVEIKLSDLFYFDSFNDIDFTVINSTDPSAVVFNIEDQYLRVLKGNSLGETQLTVRAQIRGKDIWIDTKIAIYNYSDYLIDNFENTHLEDSVFNWMNRSDNNWQISKNHFFSEKQSLKSGRISYGDSSIVSFESELEYGGIVSFAYKTDTYVSSYADFNNGSFLNFYINNNNMSINEYPELWGGINNWRVVSYELPPGNNKLQWEYSKKHWGFTDEDAVWIDNIILHEKPAPVTSYKENSQIFSVYPNPFNPETEISFILNEPQYVRLSIFDIKGREVISIFNGEMNSGKHSLAVSPSNLAGGTYFTVFRTGSINEVKKIVFVK